MLCPGKDLPLAQNQRANHHRRHNQAKAVRAKKEVLAPAKAKVKLLKDYHLGLA